VTRYVLIDLEQLGAELSRGAAEVASWLDAAAAAATPSAPADEHGEPELARAIAHVDLLCYQALSVTAERLASAAGSVRACVDAMRTVDAGIARGLCGGTL
jgi:hypothetical protein